MTRGRDPVAGILAVTGALIVGLACGGYATQDQVVRPYWWAGAGLWTVGGAWWASTRLRVAWRSVDHLSRAVAPIPSPRRPLTPARRTD